MAPPGVGTPYPADAEVRMSSPLGVMPPPGVEKTAVPTGCEAGAKKAADPWTRERRARQEIFMVEIKGCLLVCLRLLLVSLYQIVFVSGLCCIQECSIKSLVWILLFEVVLK